MNKDYFYIGCLMQIPNLILMIIFSGIWIIKTLNFDFTIQNIGLIILGTLYAGFNIASLIFIVVGLLEKDKEITY